MKISDYFKRLFAKEVHKPACGSWHNIIRCEACSNREACSEDVVEEEWEREQREEEDAMILEAERQAEYEQLG